MVANRDHLAELKFSKSLPFAFTENGAVMAANVLHSPQAVRMSVFVVRAFVEMRDLLSSRSRGLAAELRALEARLTARLDGQDLLIVDVLRRIMDLVDPPPAPPSRGDAAPSPRPAVTKSGDAAPSPRPAVTKPGDAAPSPRPASDRGEGAPAPGPASPRARTRRAP